MMQFYPVTYIASEIKSNPRFNYFVLYSDRALGFRLPFSDKTLRVRRMRRRLKKVWLVLFLHLTHRVPRGALISI